ncbi:uncharacterized protein LOC120676915 isoform X2 [Panicum virgatum]|uniref:Uncharacterized protein n=1 Tax=Panicum virgatum TaxID=38727 RepID=A0A8T0SA85_PANVG|nr:uncharacterized protein LOC120676915 isoform X2 [Panicum virgatum]KAG2593339.1 hypothetical protein PVAP13_5NG170921 [Panicum virgatum]
MSGFGQRSRPWPGDPASTPSEPAAAVAAAGDGRGEASALKDFGTSMDAISFGFAATAILISLFLLMAIFEHLIKPRAFPPDSPDATPRAARHRHGRSSGKLRSPPMVEAVLQAADLSVLMPGHRYPTYLAQPAPLPPSCPREGVHWPPHDHHASYMPP